MNSIRLALAFFTCLGVAAAAPTANAQEFVVRRRPVVVVRERPMVVVRERPVVVVRQRPLVVVERRTPVFVRRTVIVR